MPSASPTWTSDLFKQPTVIVVGAGASHDLQFPLGDELRYQLSNMFKQVQSDGWQLNGPKAVVQAILSDAKDTGTDANEYLDAARTLSSHVLYARSIDEFVDHHQGNRVLVALAKIGICAAILDREQSSNLFVKDDIGRLSVRHEFLDKNDVWLKQLWYMMRQEVPKAEPRRLFENLAFVNFNYDRTLEAFLTMALIDMYELSSQDADRFIEEMPIYHPYGVVDRLSATPYGGGHVVDLLRLKDNIRTYTESEASPQKTDYETLLGNAVNVAFLGFAYRQLNLDLLKSVGAGTLRIFGTAVGIPQENFSGIEGRLNGVFQRTNGLRQVRLRDVKCAELLRLNEEFLIS